ncbi:MAG: DUF1566 domain-containing protein, partial [Gammaproteobacteria bacterium]|nr:DUF1566 domain-containing protein [Gammaproteobacteria bacterium]
RTGQRSCYDTRGREISCVGTGQDGELMGGRAWPDPRFEARGELVTDGLTGLVWTRSADAAGFPLTWPEALELVAEMRRARAHGHGDWRLPNRRELRSLLSHETCRPALPRPHPFRDVFPGWYWTSTSAAVSPAHAWYVHLEGARMFYGGKDQSFMVWPVRGEGNGVLPATGQASCFDSRGRAVPCAGTGQDGALRRGAPWPDPRFEPADTQLIDRLTGLRWTWHADLTGEPVTWEDALAAVAALNARADARIWRLPNINELESLVDCDARSPALPAGADFQAVRDGYWSSTTSAFEPDWAWALYLDKGAVGVGQKRGRHFHVWPVRDAVPTLAADG